uniref:Uncharacterized protein n=1 Tax=Magnetococcus massalia (strain MO-1) TaxID=451514 RepID=A0A1S7LLE8_MAGMO|nr:protein of unknown function [Candidatus Magnetococcus massalia]
MLVKKRALIKNSHVDKPSFQTPQPCLNRARFEAMEKRPTRRRGVGEKWLRLLGLAKGRQPNIHSGNSLAIALRAICMRS